MRLCRRVVSGFARLLNVLDDAAIFAALGCLPRAVDQSANTVPSALTSATVAFLKPAKRLGAFTPRRAVSKPAQVRELERTKRGTCVVSLGSTMVMNPRSYREHTALTSRRYALENSPPEVRSASTTVWSIVFVSLKPVSV